MRKGHTEHWVWHPTAGLQMLSILWVPGPVLGPVKTDDYDTKPTPQLVGEPMCEGVVMLLRPHERLMWVGEQGRHELGL